MDGGSQDSLSIKSPQPQLEESRAAGRWRRSSTSRSSPAHDAFVNRLPSFFSATPGQTPPLRSSHSLRSPLATLGGGHESPRGGIDPPRPAKEGFEWVWFPGGYWAERERVDLHASDSSTKGGFKWRKRSTRKDSSRTERSGSVDVKSPGYPFHTSITEEHSNGPDMPRSMSPLASPYLSEATHVRSLQQPRHKARNSYEESKIFGSPQTSPRAIAPVRPEIMGSLSTPQGPTTLGDPHSTEMAALDLAKSDGSSSPATVHSRRSQNIFPYLSMKPMKSFIGIKAKSKEQKSKNPSTEDTEQAGSILSSALAQMESTNQGPLSRVASLLRERDETVDSPANNKPRARKLFGRAPWQRKLSKESNDSVSSSIVEMIRGHTPNPSLASGNTTSNSGNSRGGYDEQFPGNEARRINTPPLRLLGKDGRPRSFFMDVSAPATPASLPRRPSMPYHGTKTQASSPTAAHGYKSRQREWWDVPNSVPRWEDMSPKDFEFDMPEHLPSSPMCPANKKHKSGGTGLCVFHGRRKLSPLPIAE